MNDNLKSNLLAAVNEYLSSPEAWDDAMLAVNPDTAEVRLIELEEAEKLPEDIDEYDIMEFLRMTPDGEWTVDTEAIEAVE